MKTRSWDRLLPALCVLVAGCASIPEAARTLPASGAAVELIDTPFYPQEQYQCGPAALATILEASGADVTYDNLVNKVYLPGRMGSLQIELLAATRTSGRLPYIIEPTLTAVLAELEAGRPVLVLQNLGVAAIPRWHYAVVIGIDTANDAVILRSGTDRRREMPINLFLKTWSRGDLWGIVALRPGELPANPDRGRYFSSVVGLEQALRADEASRAWQAALQQWPDDTTAMFGLGNAHLALKNYAAAVQAYEALLVIDPQLVVARNNLALALAKQQLFEAALEHIDRAIELNDDTALEPVLDDTKADILCAMPGADCRS